MGRTFCHVSASIWTQLPKQDQNCLFSHWPVINYRELDFYSIKENWKQNMTSKAQMRFSPGWCLFLGPIHLPWKRSALWRCHTPYPSPLVREYLILTYLALLFIVLFWGRVCCSQGQLWTTFWFSPTSISWVLGLQLHQLRIIQYWGLNSRFGVCLASLFQVSCIPSPGSPTLA